MKQNSAAFNLWQDLTKNPSKTEGRKIPRYHPDWSVRNKQTRSFIINADPRPELLPCKGFPRAALERTSAAAFIGRVSVFCPHRPCLRVAAYFSPSLPFGLELYNGNRFPWKFNDDKLGKRWLILPDAWITVNWLIDYPKCFFFVFLPENNEICYI